MVIVFFYLLLVFAIAIILAIKVILLSTGQVNFAPILLWLFIRFTLVQMILVGQIPIVFEDNLFVRCAHK